MTLCSECGTPLAEWQEKKGQRKCVNCWYGIYGQAEKNERRARHLGDGKFITKDEYLRQKRREASK